ncbi:MAG: pyridoxamine 5'-phosphate oxidase family protein [Candidatus Omnitrophota bacterium]
MKKISKEIIQFFQDQGFVVVSTIDKNGSVHNSCKGIVSIGKSGEVYLLDLYRGKTFENLKRNSHMSITAVDEHSFQGYCLKGKAKKVQVDNFKAGILKAWEDRLTGRITQRVIKNIHGEKGHPRQPEALLPRPEYLIVVEVNSIVDLTPGQLKK